MFNNPLALLKDMLLMGYSNFWSPIFCKDKVLLFNRWKLGEGSGKSLSMGAFKKITLIKIDQIVSIILLFSNRSRFF